jgi:ketosteroid isomerase-like protein
VDVAGYWAAMSQENVAIIRRIYASWAPGSSPAESNLLHPDVEWVDPLDALEPGTRRGIDAFTSITDELNDRFEDFRMELERFIDIGDRAVVIATMRGRGSRSGIEVAKPTRIRLDHPRRQGGAIPVVQRPRRSPRSRRAAGVGETVAIRPKGPSSGASRVLRRAPDRLRFSALERRRPSG